MSKKVVFLGMGGTIAGQAQSATDNVGYKSAQVGVAQLLQAVPALKEALGKRALVSEQVAQVDSKDMEFAHWTLLAQRVAHHLALTDVDGVVITHGTDTLEETAYFLSCVVPAALLAAKPVVLTCAMRPASALVPDGPQNLLDATAVVCTAGAHGVLVVCAGSIHGARAVQKVHPYRVDAFDSGDAGPLGVVEEGAVRLMHGWPGVDAQAGPNLDTIATQPWPRVEIVMNYAGATGATVRALCAVPADGSAAVRGLVVAGTGNGTIHKDLEAALLQAQAQGVRVVRATRCARGQVVPGSVRGFAFADSQGLSPVKARIALMLALMA